MTILHKTNYERGLQWVQRFVQKAPELPFRIWPDIGDPNAVRYPAA
jgi:glyoxylate/hydroxypyruvate reductase